MILFAIILAELGIADLFRPADVRATRMRAIAACVVGLLVGGLLVWGVGYLSWPAILVAIVLPWVAFTPAASAHRGPFVWPLVALGVILLAALATNGVQPATSGWLPEWYSRLGIAVLKGVSFTDFLTGAACILFLINSTNIVTRMLISSSESTALAKSEEPKGGRLLGPVERIFIFAVALSGDFTAIAAVIAAKGILRYPEITADKEGKKIRAQAEYVLVGSFVSWGIALLFVPLF